MLYCPLPDCIHYSYTYVSFEEHIETHYCQNCGVFANFLRLHSCNLQRGGHVDAEHELDLTDFAESSRAHMGTLVTYRYRADFTTDDIETAFEIVNDALVKLLSQLLVIHESFKVEFNVGLMIEKEFIIEDESVVRAEEVYFKSNLLELLNEGEISDVIKKALDSIVQKRRLLFSTVPTGELKTLIPFKLKLDSLDFFRMQEDVAICQ